MNIVTVFRDPSGRVLCVERGRSAAHVHGADKARADEDVVGSITLDHVVTVKDGEVTEATYSPPPITDAMWHQRIAAERERHLRTSISIALSDGSHVVPVNDRSLALAPSAEQEAREEGDTVPFPTEAGIVEFVEADLHTIRKALAGHAKTVYRRERDLHKKVLDGSITESDLDERWTT